MLREQHQDLGVAALLVALEADRLGEKGILLGVTQRLHLDGGRRLGPSRLVPDGHVLQALEALRIEVGPADLRGLERVVSVDEGPAEQLFMLLGADDEG